MLHILSEHLTFVDLSSDYGQKKTTASLHKFCVCIFFVFIIKMQDLLILPPMMKDFLHKNIKEDSKKTTSNRDDGHGGMM